jgi:ligand-binding SRPBCC domain-containing protein
MSKVYHLTTKQLLSCNMEEAWAFFSSPKNLATITPASLNFKILTKDLPSMYAGQIFEYKVHPILGLPVYWMTEITQVVHQQFFIDEQRYGPYSLWHHQHHFKQVDNGIEMTDLVHYKLPLWLLGDIANSLFVKKQLTEIFTYRFNKVEEIFGKCNQPLEISLY